MSDTERPTVTVEKRRSLVRAWAPALLAAAAIFAASSLPGRALPEATALPGMDKLLHFLAYGTLGAALAHAPMARGSQRLGRVVLFAMLAGLAFGISDEFHQSFVPGRAVDARDVVADLAGAFVGATAYLRVRARWPRLFGARSEKV